MLAIAAATSLTAFARDQIPAAQGEGANAPVAGEIIVTAQRRAERLQKVPVSAIAATYREGDFHYRIPLDNGRYQVKLTFVEPSTTGKAAPTAKTAVERSFPVAITDGLLDLHFRPIEEQGIVSAIELVL